MQRVTKSEDQTTSTTTTIRNLYTWHLLKRHLRCVHLWKHHATATTTSLPHQHMHKYHLSLCAADLATLLCCAGPKQQVVLLEAAAPKQNRCQPTLMTSSLGRLTHSSHSGAASMGPTHSHTVQQCITHLLVGVQTICQSAARPGLQQQQRDIGHLPNDAPSSCSTKRTTEKDTHPQGSIPQSRKHTTSLLLATEAKPPTIRLTHFLP